MLRLVMALSVALNLLMDAGCSKPPPDAARRVQDAPLVTAPDAPVTSPVPQTLQGQLATAGTSVSYEASFADGHIARIIETRGTPDAARQGNYDFLGARLLRYEGGAFGDGAPIELEFDMQGALIATHAGRPVTAEEIAAIRTRGDLLRNHALAQQSVRSHRTQ